jgi:hypothetical protein
MLIKSSELNERMDIGGQGYEPPVPLEVGPGSRSTPKLR